MKRSVGVTAWTVLFITFGLFGVAGSVVSLFVTPNLLRSSEQQMAELDSTPTTADPGVFGLDQKRSDEETAKLRAQVQTIIREATHGSHVMREYLTSPRMQIGMVVSGLLSLAMGVGGIGMWSLKSWARTLVLWQAGLSIIRMVVGLLMPFSIPELSTFTDPAMQRTMEVWRVIGAGLRLITGLTWNGLILWFFNRASVKAQFVSKGS